MLERVAWGVLALIHLLPAIALVRPSLIERLYGVAPGGEVHLLLHHRAALFAAILATAVWALLDPAARPLAALVIGISMIAFLVLYVAGGMPAGLRTIAVADCVGLPALAYVAWRAWT